MVAWMVDVKALEKAVVMVGLMAVGKAGEWVRDLVEMSERLEVACWAVLMAVLMVVGKADEWEHGLAGMLERLEAACWVALMAVLMVAQKAVQLVAATVGWKVGWKVAEMVGQLDLDRKKHVKKRNIFIRKKLPDTEV